MTGISLGHLPCLAGTYYASLINEDFLSTGPRIGKACEVTIALDGTFTVSIDGAVEAVYKKTVTAVIGGVEQSANFAYSYNAAGSQLAVSALEFWNGGSVKVAVDPAHIASTVFVNAGSKLRIDADYRPAGKTDNKYVACEG